MDNQLCIHDLIQTTCVDCNGRYAKKMNAAARTAEACANKIFDLIPDEHEGWIPQAKLASASSLTSAQVSTAIAHLRDNYPDLPLVSSSKGYCFTLDRADVTRFRVARTRSALTTTRRLWRGVIKPFVEQGVERGDISQRESESIVRQYERLIEDLEGLV